MKKTSIFVFTALAVLLCQSCDKNHFDVYPPDELGMEEYDYYVEADGGDINVIYLSNKSGNISLVNKADESWVQLGHNSFEFDGSLPVHVLPNDGFRRRAEILFTTDTRKDTVSVFQLGAVDDRFYVSESTVTVYNGVDELNAIPTDFAVPLDEIKVEVRISGSDEWIKDCRLSTDKFTFSTTDNTDKLYTRKGLISLSYLDGWRNLQIANINVVQARADNNIGTVFTSEQLRSLATVEGYELPDDALIEGYIVSTNDGGNAGDAQVEDYQGGTGYIDYTLTERTSYLVSEEGYGFRLISKVGNPFTRYSRILLGIGGAVVSRTAEEPVCYTIEGFNSTNLFECSDVTSTLPRKEKSITELTDDDLNTLVTIKDCEIAMRKGPFTPVNEGYASLCGYNRLAKYPLLIRDIKGGSMYMFTNMTCTYRRNGETLPYGSGDITGIVVHEPYYSFEKDGNIGRYQLRHLVREDIELKSDFKDNFSGLITEFRYAKFPGEFDHPKLGDNAILATKGNGEMCHTYGAVDNFSPTYFYIGECGNNKKNDKLNHYKEGVGIELDEGGIYEPWVTNHTESAQNTDGKGWYKDKLKISWSNKYWWDSSKDRGYCWLVNFSTEGISSDMVSMQFAMYNNSQQARSPRYWKAEYSLTTFNCSPEYDEEWQLIGEFTVPDVAIWASQNDWQTLGTRVYDFKLPTEILGQESVSIRLMPRNNKAAAKSKSSYDSSTIANNSGYNTMDYFAVRYNK